VPLDKLPASQAWVNELTSQAYVNVTDYENFDRLAERVDPAHTFIGRMGEFRHYAFDIGYPDYRVPESGARWARYVRERGFHVGMYFNVGSVSEMFPELVERFKPGMLITGVDDDGNETFDHIGSSPYRMYRVSAALPDWRSYFLEQVRHAVDAGIDVIYLDESMVPHGRMLVGDTDGFQGTLLLMQEILERYPHVAIETEQFNMLTAQFGKLALSQMPLGHSLSRYIFRKFVKVVPEGVMYSPTDVPLMDAFASWERSRTWARCGCRARTRSASQASDPRAMGSFGSMAARCGAHRTDRDRTPRRSSMWICRLERVSTCSSSSKRRARCGARRPIGTIPGS